VYETARKTTSICAESLNGWEPTYGTPMDGARIKKLFRGMETIAIVIRGIDPSTGGSTASRGGPGTS